MLDKVKVALRIVTDAFDDELNNLIEAAKKDLGIAGVATLTESDALIEMAIKTYCKMNLESLSTMTGSKNLMMNKRHN